MKRHLVAAASALVGGAFLAQPASAAIVPFTGLEFIGPLESTGNGFGNFQPLLSVQLKDDESGCVAPGAGGTTIIGSAGCEVASNAGGNEANGAPKNRTVSVFGDLGWANENDVALVFNPNEGGGGQSDITVHNITLKFYNGTTVVAAVQATPDILFADSDQGQGPIGFGFALTAAGKAYVKTNVFDVLGHEEWLVALESTMTDTNSGADDWGGIDLDPTNGGGNPPPPVPETATWMMMMIGFGTMGGAIRSRRVRARVSYSQG